MPSIHLKTRRLEYKFEISRKYSIIRGDTGIGKTTLFEIVSLYSRDKYAVSCPGYSNIAAIPVETTGDYLDSFKNAVLFIDENNPLLHRNNTATLLQKSNNYFVIISRSLKLDFLPISLDSIFNMKTSGRFHTLESYFKVDFSKIS